MHKATCRAYAEHRASTVGQWRIRGELGVLSAAINYWHEAHGPLTAVSAVTLPEKPPGRDRWLTRTEAAMLLAGALGYYRVFASDVRTRRLSVHWKRYRPAINRHVARFIIIGLRTGTRRAAIFGLQWMPNTTGGWVDLDRGVMHRRGRGVAETSKRQPPTRLGSRLKAHLSRWKEIDDVAREAAIDKFLDAGGDPSAVPAMFRYVVSFRGLSVGSIRRGWDMAVDLAWLNPEHSGEARVTPHIPAAHPGDMAHAGGRRHMGGIRLARHVREDAAGQLRAPPSRLAEDGSGGLTDGAPVPLPLEPAGPQRATV